MLARSGQAPCGPGLGGGSVGWGVLRAPWPPRVPRLPCSPAGSVPPTGTEASSSPKTLRHLMSAQVSQICRTWEEAQRANVRQDGVRGTGFTTFLLPSCGQFESPRAPFFFP